MGLQIGDRATDETGEYEIIAFGVYGRPGNDVHARVKKLDQPDVTEIRMGRARAEQRKAPERRGGHAMIRLRRALVIAALSLTC